MGFINQVITGGHHPVYIIIYLSILAQQWGRDWQIPNWRRSGPIACRPHNARTKSSSARVENAWERWPRSPADGCCDWDLFFLPLALIYAYRHVCKCKCKCKCKYVMKCICIYTYTYMYIIYIYIYYIYVCVCAFVSTWRIFDHPAWALKLRHIWGPGGRWSRVWMKEIGWGLTASHGWPGWDWHGEFDGLVGRQIMKHHKLIKMKLP